MIVCKKRVRELAHARGRRVSTSYLNWIDRHVAGLVDRHCRQLRGAVTLRADDAAALERPL